MINDNIQVNLIHRQQFNQLICDQFYTQKNIKRSKEEGLKIVTIISCIKADQVNCEIKQMGDFSCMQIMRWTNNYRCQCLIIENLALWLDENKLFQKSLQISIVVLNFLTLFISFLSLNQRQQIQIYFPVYGHFLMNSVQDIQPYEVLKQHCHYFEDLSYVRFVGFNLQTFYYIRIVVLFILFIIDMLGILFSFLHAPCGTKMYILSLVVTFFFFVLFPSEFCVNFGHTCIDHSPIFELYRLQFMIQFNVAWLGIGAILLICIIYPIVYFTQRYCNVCGASEFFDVIYGIVCIPFFTIALINFVTSLWTSSAFINILTLSSAFINYLLYHAETGIGKQMVLKQKQIKRLLQNTLQIHQYHQFSINYKQNQYPQIDNQYLSSHGKETKNNMDFASQEKPDRMQFYRNWQDRLHREFRGT